MHPTLRKLNRSALKKKKKKVCLAFSLCIHPRKVNTRVAVKFVIDFAESPCWWLNWIYMYIDTYMYVCIRLLKFLTHGKCGFS